jgi:hypothetical protein
LWKVYKRKNLVVVVSCLEEEEEEVLKYYENSQKFEWDCCISILNVFSTKKFFKIHLKKIDQNL